MKKLSVLVLLALGVVALGSFYLGLSFLNSPPDVDGEEIIFEVSPGEGFKNVSARLQENGLITDAGKFYLFAKMRGKTGSLRRGEYSLSTAMVPDEVLKVITSGKSRMRPFTIPEGRNVYDIAKSFQNQKLGTSEEFLKIVRDPAFAKELLGYAASGLEGYLYPETYQVTKFTTAKDLVKQMVARFQEVYAEEVGPNPPPGFTKHQVVILASIVEKETGAPEERPMIASVFLNRLKKNMRLQTDPTVLYGKWELTGDLSMNITKQDLVTPNRYNTYTNMGLPYGPISNPGREALRAVVKPATSEFLFFVSRNNGTHVFSETYENHSRAVRDFQMNPKAREGKSWRDLDK
ncbi:MAG: endolytic transglycosylase MltG [Pseudobdellovibrionaceae bacterium]